MNENDSINDVDCQIKGYEIEIIGNNAVQKVIKENHEKGIPLVFSVDDKIVYELADGTITQQSPFKDEQEKKQ